MGSTSDSSSLPRWAEVSTVALTIQSIPIPASYVLESGHKLCIANTNHSSSGKYRARLLRGSGHSIFVCQPTHNHV